MIRRLTAAILFLILTAPAGFAEILIGAAGPLQGQYAAFGEQLRRGAQLAVDDINATGGLNGEPLKLEMADDGCEPRQAVDVATRLVAKGVKFVAGHYCSGSSIPASKIYEAAGVVQISPASTNPKFTDDGGWNVHRVCTRDDAQGGFAGRFIATQDRGRKIAILADQSVYGQSLAGAARAAIRAAGLAETLFESYTAGAKDYGELVLKLRAAAIEVVYLGGYHTEAALILRQMRELGLSAQLIGGDALVTDEFWVGARDAGEGTLMTFAPDPQQIAAALPSVERFKAGGYNPEGFTLHAYAAVQAWVQAAQATGGTDSRKIAEWLRAGNLLKTVIGDIALDGKGDVKEPRYTWFRWSEGKYAEDESLNQASLTPPSR